MAAGARDVAEIRPRYGRDTAETRPRYSRDACPEEQLLEWLQARYATVVELFYAHGLRQSRATLQSTGFSVHQDTEDLPCIESISCR